MSVCQGCRKKAVALDKIKVRDMIWHKKCCLCEMCRLQLSSKTVRESNGKTYCIKHCPKPSSALTPGYSGDRNITEERDLPYFHDEVTREEVEKRLRKSGDFLIRRSKSESAYIVSVKHSANVVHVRVPRIGNDYLFRKEVIPTLGEWVKRHMDTKTPVAEEKFLLCNPVNRLNHIESKVIPALPQRRNTSQDGTASKDLKIVRLSSCDRIFQIFKGSICEVTANGIVISISQSADLCHGALAKSIAEAGGPEIQKELHDYRRRSSKPPTFGDVIVTSGYRLPCKYIFHAILSPWQDGQRIEENLRQILRKIFQLADEKKVKSLAIPPIGTGILGYPKQVVAQVLYAEAAEYLDYHTDSSIDKIIFVVNGEMDLLEIYRKLQEKPDSGPYDRIIEVDQEEVDGYYEKLNDAFLKTKANLYTPLSDVGKQGTQYPNYWSLTEASDKPYDLVELDPEGSEYKEVVYRIVASDGEIYEKLIAKIERVENEKSYHVYEVFKNLMIQSNGNGITNERLLWHGTTAPAAENIVLSGFNRSFAGANATLYGKGVYFAKMFSYSAQSAYSPPDEFGVKHIFQCRVLTGNFCLGQKSLLEPAFLPDGTRKYDSAVDDLENPSIFVVFKDYVAYPEYLISFYESDCVSPDFT